MKWLLEEVSKNTQATEFACKAVMEQNNHLRALNGKTFKNEKAIVEVSQQVDELVAQSNTVAPFLKPVKTFATLWEYTVFRWTVYAGLFFVLTYLYPYYVTHPIDLSVLISRLLGT